MGKRSDKPRRADDKYLTPAKAVDPLLPFLKPGTRFIEPCAGDGRLVRHLTVAGHRCVWSADIRPLSVFVRRGHDALTASFPPADAIITNPPWSRHLLHPMIHRFRQHAPTWLLFDADWLHTAQAHEFAPFCTHVVSVGRVRWIEETTMDGKDNAAWYRFIRDETNRTEFIW